MSFRDPLTAAGTASPSRRASSLHVHTNGSGPDLVLLHGWGFDGTAWGDFGCRLARHFRVHRVDLPGHGHSRSVRFEELQAVTERVAHVIPPDATVCGWSLGGLVALQLAVSYPARAARLVLIAATPCFVARDDWNAGMPAQTFDGFRLSLSADRVRALRRFAGLVAEGSVDRRERLRQMVSMTTSANPDAESLDAALQALGKTDMRPAASSVTAPALMIHGEGDGLVPVAAARWLADQLAARGPGAAGVRLEVLPGASHAPFLDAPDRVADLIRAWHG